MQLIKYIFAISFSIFTSYSYTQIIQSEATEVWEPEPKVVTINNNWLPSDALVLFDGKSLIHWQKRYEDLPAEWEVKDGTMTIVPGTGDISTKEKFGSIQLHLEYRAPVHIEGKGQGRGNSGVFLQSRYEVQILDSYQNQTYVNGQAGAIYKQYIPLVNTNKAPGEWNTYDIIFDEPVFNKDGIKVRSAYLTVFQNGILIQNHRELLGTTEDIGFPKNLAHGKDSIVLQDHGNPVSFRNIWLRKL